MCIYIYIYIHVMCVYIYIYPCYVYIYIRGLNKKNSFSLDSPLVFVKYEVKSGHFHQKSCRSFL